MKTFLRILILAILTAGEVVLISAQSKPRSDIHQIDNYCTAVDRIGRKNKGSEIVIADVSDYDKGKPQWRRFVSEKQLEEFRDKNEVYNVSLNWLKNGKILASNFTLSSPSGDWAKYLYHCFRPDGSLARVSVDYRTFEGDLILLQKIYFSRNGRMIRRSSRFLDLNTRKPKKMTRDLLADHGRMIREADYYTRTSKLPFSRLLRHR